MAKAKMNVDILYPSNKANIYYIQKTIKLQILGTDIANKSDDEIAIKRFLIEIEFKGIDFNEYISKLKS